MLHIILLILKIAGFLILGILGLILLALLIVFFVPVRYRIKASGNNTPESIQAELTASWLLHLISGRVLYENGEVSWRFRLAWKCYDENQADAAVTIEPKKAAEGKSKLSQAVEESAEEETTREEAAHEEGQEEQAACEDTAQEGSTCEEVPREKTIQAEAICGDAVKEESAQQDKVAESEPRTEKSRKRRQKKPSLWERLKKFWEKIKYTFHKICDNIRSLEKKKDKLVAFAENEVHKNALERVLKELRRLLWALRPKKAEVRVEYGFADPALTGYTLAAASIIWPVFEDHVQIKPDFENRVLKGDAYVRGTLRAIHVLVLAWNLLLDKNVRTTYRHIRKFKL